MLFVNLSVLYIDILCHSFYCSEIILTSVHCYYIQEKGKVNKHFLAHLWGIAITWRVLSSSTSVSFYIFISFSETNGPIGIKSGRNVHCKVYWGFLCWTELHKRNNFNFLNFLPILMQFFGKCMFIFMSYWWVILIIFLFYLKNYKMLHSWKVHVYWIWIFHSILMCFLLLLNGLRAFSSKSIDFIYLLCFPW
jgi:hypothetical protein